MAKSKVSKTSAIREALKSVEGGSPILVAKKLNAAGVKVTAAYVSTIKAADKRRKLAGKPTRKPGRPAGSGSVSPSRIGNADGSFQEGLMLKAIDLVVEAGAKEAHVLISLADKMVQRIK